MLGTDDVRALLQPADTGGPHLSLLMPAERAFPASQQNAVRFRNLLRQAETSLAETSDLALPAEARAALLAPLQAMVDDADVWSHPQDGLAVYRAADRLHVFWLAVPLPELAVVAESFHVKPLLRLAQQGQRYQVLALHADRIRLFEGDRTQLVEIDPAPGVPRTLEDALGTEIDDPNSDSYSYDAGPGVRGKQMSRVGGGARSGSNEQAIEKDTERFFRAVDHEVARHHSRPTGLPLVLAALPQHHTLFRRVSRNDLLAEQVVDVNPDALPLDELRQRAWYALQPRFEEHVQDLVDRYGAARGAAKGDDRLQEVATAAAAGRVELLLVEDGRQVPGRMDAVSGAFLPLPLDDPQADDLLDDIAERVLALGGTVVVLERARMPSSTGLAAIYRF